MRAPASLCGPCRRDLPSASRTACPSCAAPTPSGLVCGECLADPPAFDATLAAFQYRFPLDRLVQSFKFNENLALVQLFADALIGSVRIHMDANEDARPDQVVAMPLAARRLATRGFNQSAVLAERVAQDLGIAYAPRGMLKIRDTPPQAGLDREARLKNVRGAFLCENRDVAGQHVALLDDVMTTGATMSEAAGALKKAGARRVTAWVLARADRLHAVDVENGGGSIAFDAAPAN
jgi:ComF family protein